MGLVPKKGKLVKNAEILSGTKRDMRRKLVRSNTKYSDLKRPISKKANGGLASFIEVEDKPITVTPTEFSEYSFPLSNTYIEHRQKLQEPEKEQKETPKEQKIVPPKVGSDYTKTGNNFIDTIRPIVRDTLISKGIDPKWTNYLVSQAALESGWGKHESGKFNLSGIKGKGSTLNTREFINGKMTNLKDSFKDYKDYKDWAEDYINLLTNSRYGKAFSLPEQEFMPYIIKQGYATDPNYVNKYNKVLDKVSKMQSGGVLKYGDGNKVDPTILAYWKKQNIVLPESRHEQISADNRTKELREAQERDANTRQLGNTIKDIAINTAEGITSMVYPYVGAALSLKNAYTNPNGAYIDAAGTMLGGASKPVAKLVIKGPKKFGRSFLNAKSDNIFTNSQGEIKTAEELRKIMETAQQDAREFFTHPVIREADAHNRAIFKRVTGYDGIGDINSKRLKEFRKPTRIGAYLSSEPEYARYNHNTKQLQLNLSIPQSKEQAINSLSHEFRHHGYYGEYPINTVYATDQGNFYKWKISKLYKKNNEIEKGWGKEYLLKPEEGYNNAIDLGRDLGLTIGQPYPGKDKVLKLLNEYSGEFKQVRNALDISTTPHVKRVWDALTGRYVIIPVTSSILNNRKE